MPCKGGYRERIDAGKLRREEEKNYEQSAERRYWRSLSSRVHESAEGFAGLTPAEKTYYAIGCLIGEVYNGGHEQYFFNYSGSMYGAALSGLIKLEALKTAALLQRAKELLFGERPVPIDTDARRSFLRERDQSPPELGDIDKAFWKNDEGLDTGSNRIAFGLAGDEICGFNNETTEFGVRKLVVTSSGVTQASVIPVSNANFDWDVDVSQNLVLVGNKAFSPGSLSSRGIIDGASFHCISVSTGSKIACFSNNLGSLVVADAINFARIGLLSFPETSSAAAYRLVGGPSGQVAASSVGGGRLYFINGDILR